MADTRLLETLQSIGLSENEARVYFAALSLGPSTIQKIARLADIKRTTAYSIVESLKHKGLMVIHVIGFKKLFVAEHPSRVESLLELRRNNFNKYLPKLEALYNLKETESVIKFYDGIESIKNVYEKLLQDIQPSDDYLVIGETSRWYSLDPHYFQSFMERRAKRIHTRLLLQYSTKAKEIKKYEQNYNLEIRFLPEKTLLSANIIIVPQRMIIHQLIPPIMAIVIENESIIATNRQMFEIIWGALPSSRSQF